MRHEPGQLNEADVAAILARAMDIQAKLGQAQAAEERYHVLHASAEELGISPAQLRRAIERYEAAGAGAPDWDERDLRNVLETALGLKDGEELEIAMASTAQDAGVSPAALALARDQYEREAAERLLRARYAYLQRQRRLAVLGGGAALLAILAFFAPQLAVLLVIGLVACVVLWPGDLWYSERAYDEWVREQARPPKS